MEAPIFTYIGEICEPKIRGILTASASIAAAFGMALVYFLGNQTTWRNAALICAAIPLLSMFLISFVRSIRHLSLTDQAHHINGLILF